MIWWLAAAAHADAISDAAGLYQVPTFASQQLVLEGQDLLAINGTEEGLDTVEGQLALVYNKAEQTTLHTRTIGNAFTTYFSNAGNYQLSIAAEESFAITDFRYFDDPRGWYMARRGAFGIGKAAEFPLVSDVVGGIGGGYGRILDVRMLVQAQEMFNVLGREASPEDLQRVAELIGRRNQYFQDYQYESDIYFYRDLSEALGGTTSEETYQIQLVLDSPLYNIGSRYVGWQAGADFDVAIGDLAGSEDGEDGVSARIGLGAAKAFMLGESSVLIPISVGCLITDNAVQNLTEPLSGSKCIDPDLGLTITLDFGAAMSWDHSSSWNTTLTAGAAQTYIIAPNPGIHALELEAAVQSNAALGSRLVWSNGLSAETAMVAGEDNTLGWDFTSTLTYYIF